MRSLALSFVIVSGSLLVLPGCHQNYSPNTYAANAAQEEATVLRGVIVGVRQVLISADGTIGAATGGAVGGVAGSQVAGGPVGTALGAIGGTLVGGISGAAAAQAVANTKGWEYIVQEDGDKLVSVTQTSKIALPIGLHVLVISDSQQARIVPDYTVQIAAPPAAQPAAATEIDIGPLQPATSAAPALPPLAADPTTPPPPAPSAASAPVAQTPPSKPANAVSAGPASN